MSSEGSIPALPRQDPKRFTTVPSLDAAAGVRLVGVANRRTSHGFFIAVDVFMRFGSGPPETTTGLKIARLAPAISNG
jgi:hypothetical protein